MLFRSVPPVTGGTEEEDDDGNGNKVNKPAEAGVEDEITRHSKEVREAKETVKKVIKDLVKIVADELGVTDALNCFTEGDVGSCIATGVTVLASFAGGVAGKLLAKYGAPWKWKKAAELVGRLKDLADDGVTAIKKLLSLGKCNSFVPGTKVLLADGTSRPIEQLKLGDKVKATDPETGQTTAQPVVATITGQGAKQLVEVKISTTDAKGTLQTASVTATAGHPFYQPSYNRWVAAADLQAGDQLQPLGEGKQSQVTAVRLYVEQTKAHNLTVVNLHTYYVVAGDTPLLVHNCNGATLELTYKPGWTADQIAEADAKVAALNSADRLVVTDVNRGNTSAAEVWRRAGNKGRTGADIDHKVDLQLGGADNVGNMWALDASVNRSLGSQVAKQIRRQNLQPGAVVCSVTIRARC